MNYEITNIESLSCSGLATQLTTSQDKNFDIIRKHWQKFNQLLKINGINQGKEWTKYGITQKVEGKYFYITAIPFNDAINDFAKVSIHSGSYCRFTHRGNMRLIKSTILKIYKQILPESELILNKNRELIHYEQYDHKFNWNSSDSVINIYVPFDSST